MAAFAEDLQAQVLRLQISLYACRARLAEATDSEALHDLRIALRRLRSLLRPLRGVPACAELDQRAAALGRSSGPLRDLEVLLAQLRTLGLSEPLHRRLPRLQQGYAALLASAQLQSIFAVLDEWPEQWREAGESGEWRHLRRRVRRRLVKQQRLLAAALADPAHDRHRLRLLIKRVRYGADAYPRLGGLSAMGQAHLKQAQAALGDWHDRLQWLTCAEQEADLQPCVEAWRRAMRAAEEVADLALLELRADFPASS
ncbi:CHAD domain-containing protein [Pseudomonas sp. CrR25]|nr:CHAD domain-containing protein [Pseudomonas sp. CrR25]